MRYPVLLTIGFLTLVSCQPGDGPSGELDKLVAAMTGSFSSTAQADEDSTYYDVTLHMYPIWKGEKDVGYLYVEQSITGEAMPYRQRIYELKMSGEGQFTSQPYMIKNSIDYVAMWDAPNRFNALSKDSLVEKTGCAVYLTKQEDGTYTGQTKEQECKSDFMGTSYASSEVQILPDRIITWERGFDASGNHIWGPAHGGYVFVRDE